jgi:SPP1 gp7 family putative phage head morphogenesis protein
MSCTHASTPSANAELSGDPTNTLAIRRDFLREVRRRFRRLRGLVRRTVGYENDALNLKQDATLAPNAEERESFQVSTRSGLKQQFAEWFEQAVDDEILNPMPAPQVQNGEHWSGGYVRASYEKGWKNAEGRLMQEGVSTEAVEEVFDRPVAKSSIARAYMSTFSDMRDIADDMKPTVRRIVARGFAEGVNPREMARRINNEIETIRRTRAETLARTKTVDAYSEATLDRYQQAGVDTVSHGEWATAGDARVCPICIALEGREFTIPRMRGGTFEFAAEGEDVSDALAGTYQIKPPAHPNCRCTILPVIA